MNLLRRPRRLRASAALRSLVRENELRPSDLILPLFVSEKITQPVPVASMPGVCQWPLEGVVEEAAAAHAEGIRAVLLFGIPARKDERATEAYAEQGVVQRAVRGIKEIGRAHV